MTSETPARITGLYRYPVKGFSPDPLERVDIRAGETLPFDRAYAIENGPSGFDPAVPATLPKIKFLCLMRNPSLAALRTHFDDATGRFSVTWPDGRVIGGALDDPADHAALLASLAETLGDAVRGPLKVLRADGHSFSDVALKCVHIVNLASVRALEDHLGRPVDPMRFRPNIVLDGLPPWAEFDLIGTVLTAPSGLELEIVDRTVRCAATRANPRTGERDLDLPAELLRGYGHDDFGVYAVVAKGGGLSVGTHLNPVTPDRAAGAAMPF